MTQLPDDPFILLSFVNTRLRDFYPDLDAMCGDMGLDRQALCRRLEDAGFEYDKKSNKFR